MEKRTVDIHAHILPFVDDGPTNLEQALIIADNALEEGVNTIIATPHCYNGVYNVSTDDILKACRKFKEALEYYDIPVDIRPGAEIRLNHDTVKKYDQGLLMTLNNSDHYILIELPETFLLDGVLMLIRQFIQRGVIPIIAHPERNRFILNKINIAERLVAEGALLQITSSSLMGDFGKPVMKMSENLIKMDIVSFIASDVHPGRRYRIADAIKKLEKIAGKKATDSIINDKVEKLFSFSAKQVRSM